MATGEDDNFESFDPNGFLDIGGLLFYYIC